MMINFGHVVLKNKISSCTWRQLQWKQQGCSRTMICLSNNKQLQMWRPCLKNPNDKQQPADQCSSTSPQTARCYPQCRELSGTANTTTNPATSSSPGKNARTNEKQQLCSFTNYLIYFVGSLWLPVVFFDGSRTLPMLQCPMYVRSKICNLFRGVSERSTSLH